MGGVPRPEARRRRLRPAEAGADVGDHRSLHDVDDDLRRAGARQRQHGAARPRRDRRAEGALALAQPAGRDLQRVRAHRAVPRRRRPDRDRHHRGAGRRRVGHQRPQVVHHQRVGRRHRAGVRRDQPRGPAAPARVGVRRAHRHARAWRSSATSARWRTPTSSTAAGQPRRARVPRLPRAGRPPDRPARRRLRARPAAARRRPHPPRDALARPGATLARHHVRARGVAHLARQAARAAPDGPGLRRALAHGDPGGATAHVPDGVEDGQVRRRRGPRRLSA